MTKEVKDLYDGVVKFKKEYDEFCTVDNEMLLITLCVIEISCPLYKDEEDQKLLKEAALILFDIMKRKNKNEKSVPEVELTSKGSI